MSARPGDERLHLQLSAVIAGRTDETSPEKLAEVAADDMYDSVKVQP
jgi:hypothetical protein